MSNFKTTEGEFRSQVSNWLNEYMKESSCPFELATSDPSLKVSQDETRFPDIELWLNRKAEQGFCSIELKTPSTPADEEKLLEETVKKARAMKAPYFVTWNMRDTIIWETPATGKTVNREQRKKTYPTISQINNTEDLWDRFKSGLLQNRAMELLNDLSRLYHEGHLYEIDVDATFFVKILSDATQKLWPYVHESLKETIGKDIKFRKGLQDWAIKQAIANFEDEAFYEVVSHQIVYRLLGKILFYQTLRRFREDLPKMNLKEIKPERVQDRLKELFETARNIDYQAVFEEDFPDSVTFPVKSIEILTDLVDELNKRNFSRMPQDVIGQVFEKLIPHEERHALGQYFTREDLVDLICAFCVQKSDDKILDPTCGTGTFLIRAYDRLKNFGERDHKKLLSQLWGIDIAPFPAELATINLYRQNLSEYANFPRILTKDTFDIKPNQSFEFPPPKPTPTKKTISEQMPAFDGIVGNFPYIRQELIERQIKGYKNKLQKVLFEDWQKDYRELFGKNGELKLSGQADIYAYLFFHTAKFLNENGGRIGIVTSSAWLEVDYGYELQKFFLKNFKLIAVLESLAESWFEDVPIITVVTVLERCKSKHEKENNLVKFVKFKKPLREIIPQDLKSFSNNRWAAIDRLIAIIDRVGAKDYLKLDGEKIINTLSGPANFENEDILVRAFKQGELLENLEKSGKTIKWGVNIRAPQVYFDILEKCKNKFITLEKIAELQRGVTTGINEFFHLDEERIKHWKIEKEFFAPIVTSPKEVDRLIIEPKEIEFKLFLCHKTKAELLREKKQGALSYIEWGEQQTTKEKGGYKKGGIDFSEVASVSNRKIWYDMGERKAGDFAINRFIRERFFFPINSAKVLLGDVVFEGKFKNKNDAELYMALLNSTLVFLFVDISSRFSMGDGFLTFYGPDIAELLIPDAKAIFDKYKKEILEAFDELLKRPIKVISEEVKMKDRQKFDSLVLESLGLDSKKYLPLIYDSLVNLVKERQNLGATRKKTRQIKVERDENRLKEEVIKEIMPDGPKQFPEEFFGVGLKYDQFKEISVPKEPLKLGDFFLGSQEVISDNGFVYKAQSEDEAKYVVYAQKPNSFIVKIPKQGTTIIKTVSDYERYLKKLKNQLFKTFFERTLDHKLSDNLSQRIFEELKLPEVMG